MIQDIRFGLRILRRNPAFSAAAIAILALGVASTCTVFSFAEAALLRALPYKNVSRLVAVTTTNLKAQEEGDSVSVPVFLNWREGAKGIGQFAASGGFLSQTLVGSNGPRQEFGLPVTQSAFQLVGVRPIVGHDFLPSDYRAGSPGVVLLSYSLWQRLFNGRRSAVGRSVTLDAVEHTIVGVMPPDFVTPGQWEFPAGFWMPLIFNAKQESQVNDRSLSTVWGRLNPGVSVAQAQAAMSALALQFMSHAKNKNAAAWRIRVEPLEQEVVKNWRSTLILLLGAVGFLLAIACVSVANLLLSRAQGRRKEMAVRTAMGAHRARVVRQLLTESLVLGGIGGVVGIALAQWSIRLEEQILPAWLHMPNFEHMGVYPLVLGVTLGVIALVAVGFGLAPALAASKIDLVESLKESTGTSGSGAGRMKTQGIFIVAEVALSLILLAGAGLMLRSFLKLQGVNLGFNPSQVLTMRMVLPKYQFPKASQQIAEYQEVLRHVRAIPGVESAGFVTPLPLGGITTTIVYSSSSGTGRRFAGTFCAVSPDYFGTLGIRLLRGRTFTGNDTAASDKMVIVNEAFAEHYWPGQNPVGREFFPGTAKKSAQFRVVGEVANVHSDSLEAQPMPEIYSPFTQRLFAAFVGTVVVKTRTAATTSVAMQQVIRSLDPEAPISRVKTMDEIIDGNLAGKRFYLLLVGVFALLAVVLAAGGIASTVSYAVSRRGHEISIRMALGASNEAVLWMIVSETLRLALVGVGCGVVGALALTRFISAQLYGVKPTDPLTLALVSLGMLALCLLSSMIPGFRATSVNPAETLRAT
jgi:putative ABC transport system permease protein